MLSSFLSCERGDVEGFGALGWRTGEASRALVGEGMGGRYEAMVGSSCLRLIPITSFFALSFPMPSSAAPAAASLANCLSASMLCLSSYDPTLIGMFLVMTAAFCSSIRC